MRSAALGVMVSLYRTGNDELARATFRAWLRYEINRDVFGIDQRAVRVGLRRWWV